MIGNSLLETAASWLLTYALHSTVLLMAAWLVTSRRLLRSTVAHDTLWRAALVGGILTTSLQLTFEPVAGRFDLGASPTVAASPAFAPPDVAADSDPVADGTPPVVARVPGRGTSVSMAPPVDGVLAAAPPVASGAVARAGDWLAGLPWIGVALGLWLAGAAVGVGRFLVARIKVGRLLASRREVGDPDLLNITKTFATIAGVRRPVRLTWSPDIATPVAFRSEICLPKRALAELSREHLQGILAHEVAHIARKDPFWMATGLLLSRVFFFQPLNGLARRRMRVIAEYLCDDWAVTHIGTKLSLAECLAEVATWITHSRRFALFPTMAEDGSHLVRRVERILNPGNAPTAWAPHRMRMPLAASALVAVGITVPGFP